MADQTSANVLAAIKKQSALGTPASGGSALRIRANDSPGMSPEFGIIMSNEKRTDMLKAMGRLGNQQMPGSYNCEFGVGGEHDAIIEGIMRGTFSAAVTRTYDNSAGLTSLQITQTFEITQVGTTSFIGVIFVGDIITLGGMSTAANNDVRCRVTNVTATVLTLALNSAGVGPLTVQAADIACTLTRMKKLASPAVPVLPFFTIEQYDFDHDRSQYFTDCMAVGMKLTLSPDGHIMVEYRFLGIDWVDLDTGTSPYFTSPVLTTGVKLISDDSFIRLDTGDSAKLTGMTLDFNLMHGLTKTIANAKKGLPYANDLDITGSITAVRSDLARFTQLRNETEFVISLMGQEPTAAPKPTMGLYIPRAKFKKVGAPYGGGEGHKVDTLDLMIGPKVATTIDDAANAVFFSSAA